MWKKLQNRGGGAPLSLLTRIVSVTALAFAVMVAVLSVVLAVSMRTMLAQHESDNVLNRARISESVLFSSVGYLPSVTRDWSSWDNTYDFVQGRYDDFLDEYLTEYPFQLFRINLITLLDADGNTVYERFYDHHAEAFTSDAPDLSGLYQTLLPATMGSFREGEALDLADTTQIGKAGFVSHGGQIYYFSSYPILHSDETGPAAGAFIFGRLIDDREIAFITRESGMAFRVATADTFDAGEANRERLREDGQLVLTEKGSVTAWVTFGDIFGQPTLAVALGGARTLYDQGMASIMLVLVLMVLCCVAVLAVILWRLNRIVVRPLAGLVEGVNAIDLETVDTTLPARHENRETDELTGAVNRMLERIRQASDTIQANNDSLYRLANFDQLTGLPNRYSGTRELQGRIEAAKAKNDEMTAYFIDIGRFKFVNDTLGRDAGDEVIRQVAARLAAGAGAGALVARYEGDKFLVAREGLYGLVQRKAFADELSALFTAPVEVRRREMAIEVAIGSACWPEDAGDAETLIKNAEIAVYDTKAESGKTYQAYHEELHAELQRMVELENWMREAIACGFTGFAPHFQPVVNVKNGRVEGCEALMRWKSPQGPVAPAEFIPLAEESGLIVPMTWWMLKSCCAQARHFQQSGLDCVVAVNVPAQVLLHPDFVPTLRQTAKEAGVPPSALGIEIVEATLVADFERVNRVLATLHTMSVHVSVDDFGTGYSSLSYLNRMQVDRIKIDRSFIKDLPQSTEDQAIVLAVIAVAESMDMVVTAEGVETADQLAFLKRAGCDEVQGFLFSKALPAGEFIEFARQWQQELVRSKRTIGQPRRKESMPGLREVKPTEPPQPPDAEETAGEAVEEAPDEVPGEAPAPAEEPRQAEESPTEEE